MLQIHHGQFHILEFDPVDQAGKVGRVSPTLASIAVRHIAHQLNPHAHDIHSAKVGAGDVTL